MAAVTAPVARVQLSARENGAGWAWGFGDAAGWSRRTCNLTRLRANATGSIAKFQNRSNMNEPSFALWPRWIAAAIYSRFNRRVAQAASQGAGIAALIL
jgi:hypothetical protein